jgi:hypothetical protein
MTRGTFLTGSNLPYRLRDPENVTYDESVRKIEPGQARHSCPMPDGS